MHSLTGLIKWLARDEWHDAFQGVFDRHHLPACDKAGLEAEEVVALLGTDWFMTTVWGCSFEDFLTRELGDGRNIVDDYLKRRGWKESASTRAYLAALRTSVMSIYEVSDIVPDTSFLARDLVRGGDPIRITERSATRSLKPWDRIAARVLQIGAKTIIGGGVLPFDHDASEAALQLLRNVAKRTPKERHKLADLVGRPDDDPAIVAAFSETQLLRAASPAITAVWLHHMIERLSNPVVPEVYNTDGDQLLFCTVHFPLTAGATAGDIRTALRKVSELREETETFWNWIAVKASTSDQPKGKRSRKRHVHTFSTTLDDGAVVLGNVELKEKSLELSANSSARAERGRKLLSGALGTLVAPPLVEMQTPDQLMASRDTGAPEPSLNLSEKERRTIIHHSLDQHYRKTLDDLIPMLGNVSPRSAARTPKGRQKVEAWLKSLENHRAQIADRNDPMATYDLGWLWTELGVSDLRR